MFKLLLGIGSVLLLAGCSGTTLVDPNPRSIISKESQLQSRQYQTKKYQSSGAQLMKAVIETLQDDNYIITHSDYTSGIISANRMEQDIKLELSAHVKPLYRDMTQLRFNVQMIESNFFGGESKSDLKKKYYKYLFSRVEKTLFLEKNLNQAYRPSGYNFSY